MSKKIWTVAVIILLLVVSPAVEAGPAKKGNFFRADLTDPGLAEFNVSVYSDLDRYLFAKVWQEVNASEPRPNRFLLPPLIGHYGEGSKAKMEKKMQSYLSQINSSEIDKKKTGYRLYLIKKYILKHFQIRTYYAKLLI